MHTIKIVFPEEIFNKTKDALAWEGKEKMIYLLCNSSTDGERLKFLPYKIIIPTPDDYVDQSAGHVEVHKDFIKPVGIKAGESKLDILQVHIHSPELLGGQFSGFDSSYDPRFFKHLSEQLPGIYFISMVCAYDFTEFDAAMYDYAADEMQPVSKILVIGKDKLQLFIPTGYKKSKKYSGKDESFPTTMQDRTIKAFGKESVELLSNLDFGIVGAGGVGSLIVKLLTRYGVINFVICDPDKIEESNRNRLPGTQPRDVGIYKALFYADYLRKIRPDSTVTPLTKSFYEPEAQGRLSQSDIIFGCVDSGVRHSISSLSMANLIPFFDMGAGVNVDDSFIGGQCCNIIPGRNVCLNCCGLFDRLKREFLSPEFLEREQAQGYLTDNTIPSPLVMHLDYVIAGLGFSEMLKYIWGFGTNDYFQVHVNLFTNTLRSSHSTSPGCIICQDNGDLGKGDKVPFLVPATDDDSDVPKAGT